MSGVPYEAVLEGLRPDAVVELWEIDWSLLLGMPWGTEQNIRRWVSDEYWSYTKRPSIAGVPFDPLGIAADGFSVDTDKPLPRPQVRVANPGGIMTSAMEALQGDLSGARLNRRRILARHLDDGEAPDPLCEWAVERYRIERASEVRHDYVTLELTTLADVPVRLPRRVIDPHVCSWTYRDSRTCAWDRTGKLYYTRKDVLTALQSEDDCSLTHKGCWLRFAAQTNAPLRISAHYGVGRIVR